MQNYALGKYRFGRGEKPQKNSHWAKELVKIDACPKHQNPSRMDALGKVIVCLCGYHEQSQEVSNTIVIGNSCIW